LVYAAESDPLCYPGTAVLRNLPGIEDPAELDEFELALFLTRADEPFPAGNLDNVHYRALHHHLFQDVYEWAGEVRTIRIGKGGNWFCYPEYIDHDMLRIFNELAAKRLMVDMPVAEFAVDAVHVLAEINAVHPFREVGQRTSRTWHLQPRYRQWCHAVDRAGSRLAAAERLVGQFCCSGMCRR
jgi:cell filamentation protein